MLLFLIGALRAIVEMLGLCLIGQGFLHPLAGRRRQQNAIYRFFDLITAPPRKLTAKLLPTGTSGKAVSMLTFLLLFILWIGLAWVRKFL